MSRRRMPTMNARYLAIAFSCVLVLVLVFAATPVLPIKHESVKIETLKAATGQTNLEGEIAKAQVLLTAVDAINPTTIKGSSYALPAYTYTQLDGNAQTWVAPEFFHTAEEISAGTGANTKNLKDVYLTAPDGLYPKIKAALTTKAAACGVIIDTALPTPDLRYYSGGSTTSGHSLNQVILSEYETGKSMSMVQAFERLHSMSKAAVDTMKADCTDCVETVAVTACVDDSPGVGYVREGDIGTLYHIGFGLSPNFDQRHNCAGADGQVVIKTFDWSKLPDNTEFTILMKETGKPSWETWATTFSSTPGTVKITKSTEGLFGTRSWSGGSIQIVETAYTARSSYRYEAGGQQYPSRTIQITRNCPQ